MGRGSVGRALQRRAKKARRDPRHYFVVCGASPFTRWRPTANKVSQCLSSDGANDSNSITNDVSAAIRISFI